MESLQTMLSDPESLAPTLALDLGLTPDQARLPALLTIHLPRELSMPSLLRGASLLQGLSWQCHLLATIVTADRGG